MRCFSIFYFIKGGDFLHFIFPQNYNFKNKLFGFFDYSTVFFDLFFIAVVFSIVNLIFSDINVKIFLIISICFPVIIFSVVGFNQENILYVFRYFISFLKNRKLLLYK